MNIFQRFIYGRESGGTRRSGNPSVEMAGRPGRPGGSGNFHQKTRKLPPEGPEGPETFTKRPGGPGSFHRKARRFRKLSPKGPEDPQFFVFSLLVKVFSLLVKVSGPPGPSGFPSVYKPLKNIHGATNPTLYRCNPEN